MFASPERLFEPADCLFEPADCLFEPADRLCEFEGFLLDDNPLAADACAVKGTISAPAFLPRLLAWVVNAVIEMQKRMVSKL